MAQSKTQKATEDAKTSAKAIETAAKADQAKAQETTAPAEDAKASASDAAAQAAPETQAQGEATIFDQAAQFCLTGTGSEPAEARAIWDGMGCDQLPAPLAVAAFDCAVAQGQDLAQRLLGKLGIDADPEEIEASVSKALDRQSEAELTTDFLAWRLRRYAFTGNAATKMKDHASHILRLQAFILSDLTA